MGTAESSAQIIRPVFMQLLGRANSSFMQCSKIGEGWASG
jgi:hypothetical protein